LKAETNEHEQEQEQEQAAREHISKADCTNNG